MHQTENLCLIHEFRICVSSGACFLYLQIYKFRFEKQHGLETYNEPVERRFMGGLEELNAYRTVKYLTAPRKHYCDHEVFNHSSWLLNCKHDSSLRSVNEDIDSYLLRPVHLDTAKRGIEEPTSDRMLNNDNDALVNVA